MDIAGAEWHMLDRNPERLCTRPPTYADRVDDLEQFALQPSCPDCGVVMRDTATGYVCPSCGHHVDETAERAAVIIPPGFDGPTLNG